MSSRTSDLLVVVAAASLSLIPAICQGWSGTETEDRNFIQEKTA